jgi:hypothetical protein
VQPQDEVRPQQLARDALGAPPAQAGELGQENPEGVRSHGSPLRVGWRRVALPPARPWAPRRRARAVRQQLAERVLVRAEPLEQGRVGLGGRGQADLAALDPHRGRPSSRALVLELFRRRQWAGETAGTLGEEARALRELVLREEPGLHLPEAGTIENIIREPYWASYGATVNRRARSTLAHSR